ncbi:MAG TPA: PstS family phosphate ABC transporter substrate-binding protein [Armatimonadota bacterium]|jgi:phosphate transport system substrate-binding protein
MLTYKTKLRGIAALFAVTAGLLVPAGPLHAQGGRIVIKGSDTLLMLAQQWAAAFQKSKPGTMVSVTGGGSGTGITALINGTCDIADSSRGMKAKEVAQCKERRFIPKETHVALDGITIVVNNSNPIKSLSLDQVAGIYSGKINNWSQVGGPNERITTVGRDTASGTYSFFQEFVLKNGAYRADMVSLPSNNAIAQTVQQDRGGVGYIGIAFAKKFAGRVRIVPISFKQGGNPVTPTNSTVQNKSYPISRPLYNYTRGAASGVTAEYLRFVTSPAGQKIVDDAGYVPLR